MGVQSIGPEMRNMEIQFAFCISFCWIFVVFPKNRLRFLLKISSSKSYSSFQPEKVPDLVSIKTFVFFLMFCVFCFALFVVCYYYSYCCLYVLLLLFSSIVCCFLRNSFNRQHHLQSANPPATGQDTNFISNVKHKLFYRLITFGVFLNLGCRKCPFLGTSS